MPRKTKGESPMAAAQEPSASASSFNPQPDPPGNEFQNSLKEANDRYAKILQQVFEELQRPVTEATRSYLGTLQSTLGRPEGVRDLQQAQTEYFQRVSQPLNVETGKELQGRVEEAYRDYLRDLQKALSQVDLSSLDANGLVTVGQILSTAAYWLNAAQTSSGPVS